MEAHANHFSVSEVGETVTYDIQVSTPGVYRFHMKSEFSGSVASDENDTWFRIANTSNIHFFCVSSDLVNTAEFEAYLGGGNIGKSVYYPAGNAQGRPDFGADNPGSNGYFKVFRNGDVVGGGNKWSAETIDFHSYAVYAYFPNPTTFTISMSERSAGHRVDRFALTQIDLQGPGEPTTVLDGPQSSRGSGGVVGAAENSPYTVSVTVTDTGIPQEATTIQFDWIVGTDTGGGGNPGIETIESFTLVNAVTNTDLFDITDGMQIQESTIQGIGLNIRANTNPPVVGSVSFNLSGPVSANQTENGAPYALFGDAAGDYFGNILPIGSYILSATPYPNSSLGGVPGETVTVQFTITAVGNSILPNDSLEENITVLLSPNPTSYEVNVVTQPITNIRKVHIFDVTGRLVRTMEIDEQLSKSGQFGFDVLGIEDGVYIIQMLSNSNQKISEHRLVIRQ
ncbi:MAG: T9SS C-terminal target domain-containing protein [Allomuricauda sp.]|nr:MAG: T9SS C-terminal target domain-containing protein [Allomuricauda sp.]